MSTDGALDLVQQYQATGELVWMLYEAANMLPSGHPRRLELLGQVAEVADRWEAQRQQLQALVKKTKCYEQ